MLAAFMAYKKAKSTGRSGILWAAITVGVYIGIQLAFALGIGVFLGVGVELLSWSETVYVDYNLLITAVCVAVSFGGVWLVFRHLDKLPDDEEVIAAPPPPPTFDE